MFNMRVEKNFIFLGVMKFFKNYFMFSYERVLIEECIDRVWGMILSSVC